MAREQMENENLMVSIDLHLEETMYLVHKYSFLTTASKNMDQIQQ